MAGHSKWKNIRKTKEANDKKRGAEFSRLSKEITVSTRLEEEGDPDKNSMLKLAVDKAKAANMPKDKIEKAINKGLGIFEGDVVMSTNVYEAYGPNGAAILIECETDNANRTITEVRNAVRSGGGKMASEGSLSWQFEEFGIIELQALESMNRDDLMLDIMDIEGIVDIRKNPESSNGLIVKTERESLKIVTDALKIRKDELQLVSANLDKIANNKVEKSEDEYENLESFLDQIREVPEVEEMYTNIIKSS